MGESIAFDRAAEFYDRTRVVDDEAMARTVSMLRRELGGRAPVLEVGVGTGLLALPLREVGVDVHGLDLSPAMLRKLVEKTRGAPPLSLVLGDATRMPFSDGAFGGAYLRWVLHLIADWRRVLAETVRVVRSGGRFLANLGAYGGLQREIQQRFAELTGTPVDPIGLGWAASDELDAEMARLGATVRELEPLHEGAEQSIRSFLDAIRDNLFSWTWRLQDDVRLGALAQIESWARERFGDLDAVRRIEHATVWRAYDLS